MLGPSQIASQINILVGCLIEIGLSIDQNPSFLRELRQNCIAVTFTQADLTSLALKKKPYSDVYHDLDKNRVYSVRFPDGAFIQMMYMFENQRISSHRLAFYSSPHLDQFQNDPELYSDDIIFADVIARQIVPFPLRFDFSSDEAKFVEIKHPKTHLTLGQYENCRIPVTSPVTPYWFINFVLQNFYHTPYHHFVDKLQKFETTFEDTISVSERGIIHLHMPTTN